MMICEEHARARAAWDRKPALRAVYSDLYERILRQLAPGSVLEVGGGGGRLKEFCPHAITCDIMLSPYVDLVADAQALPIRSSAIDNIVMVDVLHHIPVPRRFLSEVQRVLRPGGRLVMMEPAITTASYLFYRLLHPEPFDLSVDPLDETPLSSDLPYDANQAIPTLLVTRFRQKLATSFAGLELVAVEWLSLIAYPLSGGLRRWSLLSARMTRTALTLEDRVPQAVARHLAFRASIVIERRREYSMAEPAENGSR